MGRIAQRSGQSEALIRHTKRVDGALRWGGSGRGVVRQKGKRGEGGLNCTTAPMHGTPPFVFSKKVRASE